MILLSKDKETADAQQRELRPQRRRYALLFFAYLDLDNIEQQGYIK